MRTPIALGYTRGHFSALVPMEPYSRMDGHQTRRSSTLSCNVNTDHTRTTFLPLMDRDRKLLPIHFLTESEVRICLVVETKMLKILFSFAVGERRGYTSSMVRCMRNRKWNTGCSTAITQKAFIGSSDVGGMVESLSPIIVSILT